jgi:hypothetical protein
MSADWRRVRRSAFRVAAGVVTAALVGVAGALALCQASVQPRAAIVKAVFEGGPLVRPPTGFAQIARTVREQRVQLAGNRGRLHDPARARGLHGR